MPLKLQILSTNAAEWKTWCQHKLKEMRSLKPLGVVITKYFFFPKNITAQITCSDICDIIRIWEDATGFICHPRSDLFLGGRTPDNQQITPIYDYPLVDDDHGSVILSPSEDVPVQWDISTDVENYGNNDWIGNDGTVLSWRGPTGRDLPYDYHKFISGLTVGDGQNTLGEDLYTVFSPNIYQSGEILTTVIQQGSTPAKVLGAAFINKTVLITIINNNYENMPNPNNTTGGFFEEVWILAGKESKRIGFKQAGRPTNSWFFSSDGKKAVNDIYTLSISDDIQTAIFGQIDPVYGTRNNHQSPDGSRQDWGFTQLGSFSNNYPDFLGLTEKSFNLIVSGSESTAFAFDTITKDELYPIMLSCADASLPSIVAPTGNSALVNNSDLIEISGGVAPYDVTLTGSGVTLSKISETQWQITSLGTCNPGDSAWGTITVTDFCGHTTTKDVRKNLGSANWCCLHPHVGIDCGNSLFECDTDETYSIISYGSFCTVGGSDRLINNYEYLLGGYRYVEGIDCVRPEGIGGSTPVVCGSSPLDGSNPCGTGSDQSNCSSCTVTRFILEWKCT